MLTAATLALLGYALYTVGWSVIDLVVWSRLERWADVATSAIALLLFPAAVLIRARIPGGLPLGFAALLGLQAISLHNSMHLYGEIRVLAESARAAFWSGVMVLALAGQRKEAAARKSELQSTADDTPDGSA
ncbi:MAG: hypothetical protein NT151_08390 [Acidobacteria bacterium]|nr:hypothetical protein [Acidobacteriota bacterium]